MANKNTIIKYNIGKKEYHVSVDFRENSMGIKMDSSDMLELCYLWGFYCLEDLSDKLMKIHKIEKNEKNFGGSDFTKTLHFMAQEIVVHMDFYVYVEYDKRLIEKMPPVIRKYYEELRKMDIWISKHVKKADIGSNLKKDKEAGLINTIFILRRPMAIFLDGFFYNMGKNSLKKETDRGIKYICWFKKNKIAKIEKNKSVIHKI